eukprot:1567298-Pleurochrysis_carterae.AAC.1
MVDDASLGSTDGGVAPGRPGYVGEQILHRARRVLASLGSHPTQGDGFVELSHESRRRLPCEIGVVRVLHFARVTWQRRQNLVVFCQKRVLVTTDLLIGRVRHCAHACLDDDQRHSGGVPWPTLCVAV